MTSDSLTYIEKSGGGVKNVDDTKYTNVLRCCISEIGLTTRVATNVLRCCISEIGLTTRVATW